MANIIVDKMMPQALSEAQKFVDASGGIKSKYLGAISSFGTSVVSSGLRPTLLFYGAKGEKFMSFESALLAIVNAYLSPKRIDDIYFYENTDFVLDAVMALKLAMRTYEKIENKGGQNE